MASRTTQALIDEQKARLEELAAALESLKDEAAKPLTPLQAMAKSIQDQAAAERQRLESLKELAAGEDKAAKAAGDDAAWAKRKADKDAADAAAEVAARMKKAAAALDALEGGIKSKARGNLESAPLVGGVIGAYNRLGDAKKQKADLAGAGGGSAGAAKAASVNVAVAGLGAVGAVAGAVVGTFQQVVSTAVGFVQAFAPSTVEVLNQAMEDLTATVGVALVPIVQAASDFFKEFASALLPLMEQLRPVVQQLSDVFSSLASQWLRSMQPLMNAVVPLAEAFGVVVEAIGQLLEPFFALQAVVGEIVGAGLKLFSAMVKEIVEALRPVITLFQMAGDFLRAFAAVAGAVLDSLMGAFGGGEKDGLKDACEQMRSAFRKVIGTCVLLVAAMAKMFGFDKFVENLKAKLAGPERKSAGGLHAAKNSSFANFAEFGKKVAMSASIASGDGHETKEQVDFLKAIADKIGEFDGRSLKEIIRDGVAEAIPGGTTFRAVAIGVEKTNKMFFGI